MTTWVEYRTAIRESVLKDAELPVDSTATQKWSNDNLLMFYEWSVLVFANHTSYYIDETIISTDVGQDFDTQTIQLAQLADDQWWKTAVVTIDDVVVDRHYLSSNGDSFTFTDEVEVSSGSIVRVRYYAFYPVPTADDDVLAIPKWSESALTHLIAYFALMLKAVDNSTVNQWNTKRDSGNPEHNAVQDEQRYLYGQYQSLINLRSRQDRDKVMSL